MLADSISGKDSSWLIDGESTHGGERGSALVSFPLIRTLIFLAQTPAL